MKAKVATEWLSACGGCHVAIIDLHERLARLADAVEIRHCPFLVDVKEIAPVKVGIITGGIRSDHDREVARKMREASELLIAFGTCAVFGGIGGAGNISGSQGISNNVHGETPDMAGDGIPEEHVPVMPVNSAVQAEVFLPGCPPHPEYIFESIMALLEGRDAKAGRRTVCSRCERVMEKTDVSRVKRWSEGVPDAGTCFLSQGYICLGPATVERCHSRCPNKGIVCTGCAGPSLNIITEPNRDIRTEVAGTMAAVTRIPYKDALGFIEEFSRTHYAYTMSSPAISGKPTSEIRKWVTRAGGVR